MYRWLSPGTINENRMSLALTSRRLFIYLFSSVSLRLPFLYTLLTHKPKGRWLHSFGVFRNSLTGAIFIIPSDIRKSFYSFFLYFFFQSLNEDGSRLEISHLPAVVRGSEVLKPPAGKLDRYMGSVEVNNKRQET